MRINLSRKNLIVLVTLFSLIVSGFIFLNGIQNETEDETGKTLQVADDCTFNGIALHGKVQFVESNADIKVKIVDSFPDLNVKVVNSFPDECGEWQIVDSFPDFKVQIVESFPDIKVKFVESFPGLP